MTILDSIRDYIAQCPHLKTFNEILTLYVDHTNMDEISTYSIEEGVAQPVLKTYVNGDTRRQFLFIFSSVEFYSSDIQNNLDNCGFYEDFSQWLEDNTNNKTLPIMGDKKEALKVEALTNGYLFNNSEDGTKAKYQIQCKLTYFQKK